MARKHPQPSKQAHQNPAPAATAKAGNVAASESRLADILQRPIPLWVVNALVIGIVLSLLVHFTMLQTGFSLPEIKLKKQDDAGLKVVLVNAKHARAPKDPQALAQANMDGGGNVDDKKALPTSPLPPEDTAQEGDSLVEAKRRVQQLEAKQRELMTQAKSKQAAISHAQAVPTENQPQAETPQASGVDLLDMSKAIARQQAIVDQNQQQYAERPRKTFIGARTQEYRLAQYAEDWRQKVQRVGTLNYPSGPNGRLFGTLMVSIEIRSDGSVAKAEISKSSGNKLLDDAALRIVQLASPFSPFPPNIKADTDIIGIERTWTFARDTVTTSQ